MPAIKTKYSMEDWEGLRESRKVNKRRKVACRLRGHTTCPCRGAQPGPNACFLQPMSQAWQGEVWGSPALAVCAGTMHCKLAEGFEVELEGGKLGTPSIPTVGSIPPPDGL